MPDPTTHRVLVQAPGEPVRAVLCALGHGGDPECLRVVARHQAVEPEGTEIHVEERVGRRFVPKVLWFRARGKWHRHFLPAAAAPNPARAITIGRSKANPGLLSVTLRNRSALRRLSRALADMTPQQVAGVTGLELNSPTTWPLTTELEYRQTRGGARGKNPNRWDVSVWWNNIAHKLRVIVLRGRAQAARRVDRDALVEIDPLTYRLTDSQRDLLAFGRLYPMTPTMWRRFDAKALVIRALNQYCNEVL